MQIHRSSVAGSLSQYTYILDIMTYTLNPIMSPRARIPRNMTCRLIPVMNVTATRVTSSRKKIRFRKIRTELLTPGSNAFSRMSVTKPRGSDAEVSMQTETSQSGQVF